MNDIQHTFAGENGGASEAKVEGQIAAVGTFEGSSDLAFIGSAAAFTKWRVDESNLCAATGADEPFGGCGSVLTTKLADFGIAEGQGCVSPILEALCQSSHRQR